MNFGVGLVSYKMSIDEILSLTKSLEGSQPKYKVVVDNSPTDDLKCFFVESDWEYIHDPSNPGFGTSHNRIFNEFSHKAAYHLIVNPDVTFDNGVIFDLVDFLEKTIDAGCVIPKIFHPNGEFKKPVRYLPTFLELSFARVWLFGEKIRAKTEFSDEQYENQVFRAPFVSGCFILFKRKTLLNLKFFDERFFMYMEDMDLSRRLWLGGYFPYYYAHAKIVHAEKRESSRSPELFFVHVVSAIKYFLKWGFFSKEESRINKQVKIFLKLK
jgi:GT2 family glycosyltransferase